MVVELVALVGVAAGVVEAAPPQRALRALLGRHVSLDADDGFDAGPIGGLVEIQDAVHVAVVGDGDGGLAVSGGPCHHLVHPGGAVEHRELGVEVKVANDAPTARYTSTGHLLGRRALPASTGPVAFLWTRLQRCCLPNLARPSDDATRVGPRQFSSRRPGRQPGIGADGCKGRCPAWAGPQAPRDRPGRSAGPAGAPLRSGLAEPSVGRRGRPGGRGRAPPTSPPTAPGPPAARPRWERTRDGSWGPSAPVRPPGRATNLLAARVTKCRRISRNRIRLASSSGAWRTSSSSWRIMEPMRMTLAGLCMVSSSSGVPGAGTATGGSDGRTTSCGSSSPGLFITLPYCPKPH